MAKKRDWKDVVDERCGCGHLKSQHLDSLAPGHGVCGILRCKCAKFTWKSFIYRRPRSRKGARP